MTDVAHSISTVGRVGRLANAQFLAAVEQARCEGIDVTATRISSNLLEHYYRLDVNGGVADGQRLDELFAAFSE